MANNNKNNNKLTTKTVFNLLEIYQKSFNTSVLAGFRVKFQVSIFFGDNTGEKENFFVNRHLPKKSQVCSQKKRAITKKKIL